MSRPTLFLIGIILLVIGIAAGVFFLIPGIPHIIADTHMHIKHAAACFVLALVGLAVLLINRPRTQVSALS